MWFVSVIALSKVIAC